MAVSGKNRHDGLATILRRHFNATAARCGWGANAEDIVAELLARVEPAIAAATLQIPPGFPLDVAEAIFNPDFPLGLGMAARAVARQFGPD